MIAALGESGLSSRDAAGAADTLTYYVVGHTIEEQLAVALPGGGHDATARLTGTVGGHDLLGGLERSARLRSGAAGQGWSPTRAIARVSGTPSISRLVIVAARAPRVPFDRSLSAMANTTP